MLGPEDGIGPDDGFAVELEFTLGVKPLKTSQELTGEQGSDGMIGEEEARLLGSHPETIGSKTPSGDQTVEMRMVHKVLSPSVKKGCKPELSVELLETKLQEGVGC